MKFIATCILLCILNLVAWSQAKDKAHALSVGDKAPDITAFKWVKGKPIEKFVNGQIYVIEFGATWCGPCKAAIPHLTELSRKYRNEISVVSFFVMEINTDPKGTKNPAYVTRVEKYVEKQSDQMDYNIAVDDPEGSMENRWLKAAGKIGIPYIFVIDKTGHIAWIGSDAKEVDAVIQFVISPEYSISRFAKSNQSATPKLPGLIEIADNDDVLQMSSLSKYNPGQSGEATGPYVASYLMEHKFRGKVVAIGESLRRLYYMAYADTLWNYPLFMRPGSGIYPDTIKFPNQRRSYGRFWYRPVLEVSDSTPFESTFGQAPNRYNYVLKMPREKATAKRLQQAIQSDLQAYFGYRVKVEKRKMPCWKLIVSDQSKISRKPSNGSYTMYEDESGSYITKNGEVRDIIFQLEIRYGYGNITELVTHHHLQPPFIDATGITGKIDYVLDAESARKIIDEGRGGPPFTFLDYKNALNQMGFDLVKGYKEMDVVVIRDAKL